MKVDSIGHVQHKTYNLMHLDIINKHCNKSPPFTLTITQISISEFCGVPLFVNCNHYEKVLSKTFSFTIIYLKIYIYECKHLFSSVCINKHCSPNERVISHVRSGILYRYSQYYFNRPFHIVFHYKCNI